MNPFFGMYELVKTSGQRVRVSRSRYELEDWARIRRLKEGEYEIRLIQ